MVVEKMVIGVDDVDGGFPLDDVDRLIVLKMREYESASAYTIYRHLVEEEGKDIRRATVLNRLNRLVEENIIFVTTRTTPDYNIKLYCIKDKYDSWK